MKIPKYVIELMGRAKYNYTQSNSTNYAVGYTIDMLRMSVVLDFIQSMTYSTCSLFSFSSFDFTTSAGYVEITMQRKPPARRRKPEAPYCYRIFQYIICGIPFVRECARMKVIE